MGAAARSATRSGERRPPLLRTQRSCVVGEQEKTVRSRKKLSRLQLQPTTLLATSDRFFLFDLLPTASWGLCVIICCDDSHPTVIHGYDEPCVPVNRPGKIDQLKATGRAPVFRRSHGCSAPRRIPGSGWRLRVARSMAVRGDVLRRHIEAARPDHIAGIDAGGDVRNRYHTADRISRGCRRWMVDGCDCLPRGS